MSGGLIQAFVLVTGIVVARVLGPEDRGYLALLWVIGLTLNQFGTLGVPQAVTYAVARDEQAGAVVRRALPLGVRQLAVLLPVHCVAVGALIHLTDVAVLAALLSLVVTPMMTLHLYALAIVQGSGRIRSFQILRSFPSVAYAVVLLAGVALGGRSLVFVTAAWVLTYSVAALATATVAWRRVLRRSLGSTSQPEDHVGLLRFGLAALFGTVSPTETMRVDQLVAGIAVSVRDMGIYSTALAFCNLPRFFAQAIGLVAYPRIAAERSKRRQLDLTRKYLLAATAAVLIVTLPMILLAEPLVEVAFGDAFAPAAGVAQVLLLGTVFLCLRRVLSDCLRGAGRPGAGSTSELLSWVWLVPGLALLVPAHGIDGVALALAASYFISCIQISGVAVRHFRHKDGVSG